EERKRAWGNVPCPPCLAKKLRSELLNLLSGAGVLTRLTKHQPVPEGTAKAVCASWTAPARFVNARPHPSRACRFLRKTWRIRFSLRTLGYGNMRQPHGDASCRDRIES